MFLLILFCFFLILSPVTYGEAPSGIELVNGVQMKLEVNVLDQCMSRPENGPNGIYESAMRFKFLVQRGQNCSGSLLLCYPGQLDPNKNFGFTIPTTHWAIPNMPDNSVAQECDKIRKLKCIEKLNGCVMSETPWHGLKISYARENQLALELSIGGSYILPLTNFTLMLHNDEVHDKADPAAYLVDDFDHRDICADLLEDFPVAGQNKPVVSKILLSDNDESYTDWKKFGGQRNKLRDHQHLFRLPWDMLPKTQLDDNDLMHIWTNINSTCQLRVFFMDRTQSNVDNLEICPTEAPFVPHEICHVDWMPIRAAKLDDEFGTELAVRVGFIGAGNNNAEDDYLEMRSVMMENLPGNGTALTLPLGDFFYASVQDHFLMSVSMEEQFEAWVYNCTFGTVSTKIRIMKSHANVHSLLDWSKDFDDVNHCIRSQKLLAKRPLVLHKRRLTIKAKEFKNKINERNETSMFIKAHQYKFGYFPRLYRNSTVESAGNYSRVKEFGKYLANKKSDIYKGYNYQKLSAQVKIDKSKIQPYISNGSLEAAELGLYALQYLCQNVDLQLPRFIVAILNDSETEYRQKPVHLEGYSLSSYKLYIAGHQWNILASKSDEKCLFSFDEMDWIFC